MDTSIIHKKQLTNIYFYTLDFPVCKHLSFRTISHNSVTDSDIENKKYIMHGLDICLQSVSHLCCRVVVANQVDIRLSSHAHGNLCDGRSPWPPYLHNTQGQSVSQGQTIFVNRAWQNALKTNKKDIYLLH